MPLQHCRMLTFPKIKDHRGNLSFIEGERHIPFEIRRIYYLYDVPGQESRGGHAHRELEQVILAINGSFDVVLDDGCEKTVYRLQKADEGLYVCPGIWRELESFTSGSVCLVLASEVYKESDYYRDYEKFVNDVKEGVFER